MSEHLWETLIDHVLSWPVAILFLSFILRPSLSRLVDRVSHIKGASFELSTPTRSAQYQLDEAGKESARVDLLTTNPSDQRQLPLLDEDLQRRRDEVKAYGGNDPVIGLVMSDIETNLESLSFQLASKETSELLIRHLAVTQILHRFERLYRLAFGSQIALVEMLNQQGPQREETLLASYQKAQQTWPDFYSTFNFDVWIGFLISSIAILKEGDVYFITQFGQAFLAWKAQNGIVDKIY